MILIAGTDEAGRGALAGAVFAAAVILEESQPIIGLQCSKTLSAERRSELAEEIRQRSLAWALGRIDAATIDQINILQSSLLAMKQAVEGLSVRPHQVLVDGTHCPQLAVPVRAIVRGDATEPAISAASILAKVARDEEMILLDRQYPGYGLSGHKGYPTGFHLKQLAELGPSPVHRLSYRPVREASVALQKVLSFSGNQ